MGKLALSFQTSLGDLKRTCTLYFKLKGSQILVLMISAGRAYIT